MHRIYLYNKSIVKVLEKKEKKTQKIHEIVRLSFNEKALVHLAR